MESIFIASRNLRLALSLTLGLCLGNVVRSAPSIESIQVLHSPLIAGQSFTIAVLASSDVTQAVATVDFHPGEPRLLEIALAKQGLLWTGASVVPADLHFPLPSTAGGMVTVAVFDAAHRRAEGVVHVGVNVPFISAVFAGGVLTVTGDDQDNTLVVSRDAAGTILVNGGTLAVIGGVPTIANTTRIRILGFGGNDMLQVDDINGPMPPSNLFGGEGDDTLTGSANADELDGGPGNDRLFGRDGNDRLLGGPGNDILIGGRGNDAFFGGDDDDQMVWNPGDGSDLIEGENGHDTLLFFGANVSEAVDLSANGQRFRFFRNVASITMDCAGIERVIFHALGGTNEVTVNDLSGTQVTEVLLDLSGNSSTGTNGQADTVVVVGTDADDNITVAGSTNEVNVLGLTAAVTIVGVEPGLDQLVLNARGGADVVDFFGSSTNELVDLSTNGQRLRFFSNAASIMTDCDNVEQVNFHAAGGADQIVINDLTGTSVAQVGIDLSGKTPGAGNGQADAVFVNGTDTNDLITVTGSATAVSVLGLTATVTIVGAEPGLDELVMNARGGIDVVDASAVQAGVIDLTLNGGPGNDVLMGGQGNDLLIGGQGADTMFGGAGDDTFVWNPGDGSDIIEGQAGQDTMLFHGANIGETVDISANGQRVRFSRNVGSITMDCNEVELIQFNALGGADMITVNDLTGTGVTRVNLDLDTPPDSGIHDNQQDTVIVAGTSGNDAVTISGTPAGVSVLGLSATVNIVGSEPALDQLIIQLLAGDDTLEASDLQDGVITLTVDGGTGDDVLTGSAGADTLLGDEGDDVLIGGPGQDVLDGGPGSNVVIQ